MKGSPSDSFYMFPADSAVLKQTNWQDLSVLLATPDKFERTGGRYLLSGRPMPSEAGKQLSALSMMFTVQPFIMDEKAYVTLTDGRGEWMVIAMYLRGDRFEDECYLQIAGRLIVSQDAQKGLCFHPPDPGGYFTRPPGVCEDSLFAQGRALSQARPQRTIPFQGVTGMIPTARVQRGPSKAARCTSKGIVPTTPLPFQHPDYSTRYPLAARQVSRIALIVESPSRARAWSAGL